MMLCADSELCAWSAGAGCGPAYTRCPSGAPAARGLVCIPAFLSGATDTTWSHHQRIGLGVFPVQPVQHHHSTHGPRLEKSMRQAHAEPRRAEQRLQLRSRFGVGQDRQHLYQRTQVSVHLVSVNILGFFILYETSYRYSQKHGLS